MSVQQICLFAAGSQNGFRDSSYTAVDYISKKEILQFSEETMFLAKHYFLCFLKIQNKKITLNGVT